MSGDELTFEDIDALLQRAENRLREAQHLATAASDLSSSKLPHLNAGSLPAPYVQTKDGVAQAEKAALVKKNERHLSEKPRRIDDPVAMRQSKKEKAPVLSKWHDLPKTKLTPEFKRDLQLLHMRSVLDPKRMYKKQGKLKIPEYSQVGTLIEGPTEFFSARLANKDRSQTFVEDVIVGEKENGRFKKKFAEVQLQKRSGKKAWYKAQMAKRSSGLSKRFEAPVHP